MSSSDLSREQVIDILKFCGATKIKDRGKDNIQYCCPVHGESTPSMGYSMSKGICHCFSCHFSGTIEWLVFKSLPEDFTSLRDVEEWILNKYGVDVRKEERKISGRILKRYGDDDFEDEPEEEIEEQRFELPKSYLAPFKSGKETYKYFFDRGFTKKTMQEFMIGRDLNQKTVTLPIFHADGVLGGVIGRFIDPNRPKNSRYAVYEFPKGTLLYPIHKFKPLIHNGQRVCVLVEGNFDSLWCHQEGHPEVLAIQGNGLTKKQAEILKGYDIDIFVLAFDNDKGGDTAIEITKRVLGDEYTYKVVKYPEGAKDPQDLSKEQLDSMLDMALKNRRKFQRII